MIGLFVQNSDLLQFISHFQYRNTKQRDIQPKKMKIMKSVSEFAILCAIFVLPNLSTFIHLFVGKECAHR